MNYIESGLPDFRAGARLLQQPSSLARSAHPQRSALLPRKVQRTFLGNIKGPALRTGPILNP